MTTIERIKQMVLAAAKSAEEDAGYGGRMDDGGASRLRDQVAYYEHGQRGEMPPEWRRFEVQLDPEWGEYQRLQDKFGK